MATGFEHPRSLYVLPNGDVLVVESNGPKAPIYRPKDIITGWVQWFAGAKAKDANRITLLRDTNGDGIPEAAHRLSGPPQLAVWRRPGRPRSLRRRTPMPSSAIRIRMDRPASPRRAPSSPIFPAGRSIITGPRALLASPDGSKLYVGVGSNSNITENGIGAEYERAAIWEVDRASGAHRIFASGVRNPTGLQWEPETGKLWAIANERDEIGPDLVPDYLTSVQDGGFYGWPYSYYGQHLDPRVVSRSGPIWWPRRSCRTTR